MWSIHSTLCFPVGYLVVPKSFCNKLCFPHWFDGLPYNTVNFLVCWVSFGLVFCAVPPASQWAMVSVLFNNLSELLLRLTFPFQRFFFVIVVFVLVILPILPFLINTCLNLFYLEWFSSTTSVLSTAVNSLLRPESFHLTGEKHHLSKAAVLPPLCPQVCSLHLRLCSCKRTHLYHLSRCCTHVLIPNTCFPEGLRVGWHVSSAMCKWRTCGTRTARGSQPIALRWPRGMGCRGGEAPGGTHVAGWLHCTDTNTAV